MDSSIAPLISTTKSSTNDQLKLNVRPDMEKLIPKTLIDCDRYALYRKCSSSTEMVGFSPEIINEINIIKLHEEELTMLISNPPATVDYLETSKKILVLGTKPLFCKTKGVNYDYTFHTSKEDIKIIMRPSVEQFISIMSCFYDIALFSDYSLEFTNQILSKIDSTHNIKKVFARSDCIKIHEKGLIKDLRKLTTKLSNIVLVDCSLIAFALQPENGILISRFKGDKKDSEIKNIGQFLFELSDASDVRSVVRQKYKYIDFI